jgi:hypothetical protein
MNNKNNEENNLVQTEYDSKTNTMYKLVIKPHFSALLNAQNLEKDHIVTNNANFKSYKVDGYIPMNGTLYQNNQPTQKEIQRVMEPNEITYVTETYEEYITKIDTMENINTEWIKKIIDDCAEQDKIIYRDVDFIIVRDWKFDVTYSDKTKSFEDGFKPIFNFKELHLLGIPTINIKSIRDIEFNHIPILDKIKNEGIKACEELLGIDKDHIKIYFHYPPSTYHLHIHFTWVGLNDLSTNFERSHEYDAVIKNIKLDNSYYKSSMRHILID